MRILALDTSTAVSAVAIIDGDRVLAEDNTLLAAPTAAVPAAAPSPTSSPLRHGQVLVPRIQAVLAQASLTLAQIDLIAVGVGPGSFTGLRVGLATAKGLAFALDKPVRGVSSLEVIAASALEHAGLAIVLLDAFKGEVYAGAFKREDPRSDKREDPRSDKREDAGTDKPAKHCVPIELLPLFHASPADAAQRLLALLGSLPQGAACALCGDGVRRYADALLPLLGPRTQLLPPPADTPRGAQLARLAARALQQHGPSDLATLEPSYVRASDARLPDRPLVVD